MDEVGDEEEVHEDALRPIVDFIFRDEKELKESTPPSRQQLLLLLAIAVRKRTRGPKFLAIYSGRPPLRQMWVAEEAKQQQQRCARRSPE